MKAFTSTVCSSGGVASGRVHRPRRDIENEEIQMYLSKLKELVPFMPKNRRLSKLEVIEHVIEYICDLQYALESHPTVNAMLYQHAPTPAAPLVPSTRQPLAPRQASLPPPCLTSQDITTFPAHLMDKVPAPSDTRSPVSC